MKSLLFLSVSVLWLISIHQLTGVTAFVPLIDGGKGIPKLYEGYFNEQIAKQAGSAVSRAIGAGKTKIEVNFPPVPNLDGKCFTTTCSLGRSPSRRPGTKASLLLEVSPTTSWVFSLP